MSDREEFEKWYASKHDGFCPNFYDGEYDWGDAQMCWESWQAARAQGGEAVAYEYWWKDSPRIRSVDKAERVPVGAKGLICKPLVYAAPEGVPEQAYAEAAQVINAIHSASQHCDCGAFELAQHWRNETHGGDMWLVNDQNAKAYS